MIPDTVIARVHCGYNLRGEGGGAYMKYVFDMHNLPFLEGKSAKFSSRGYRPAPQLVPGGLPPPCTPRLGGYRPPDPPD